MSHRRKLRDLFLIGGSVFALGGFVAIMILTRPGTPPAAAAPKAVQAAPIAATPTRATSATPVAEPDAAAAELRGYLVEKLDTIKFVPTGPSKLVGLAPGQISNPGPQAAPWLSYYLYNPNDRASIINVIESTSGYGTIAPLPNMTSTTKAEVLGVQAEAQIALPSGDRPLRHQIIFTHGGIDYLIIADGVALEALLQLLNSLTPIR